MTTEIDRGDELTEAVAATGVEHAAESVVEQAADPQTGEQAADPQAGEQPRDESGKFIPKAVFDNRLRSEREAREAAERRIQELEARAGEVSRQEDVQAVEQRIQELESVHARLLMDGDHERAAQAMRDIRMMERQIAYQVVNQRSQEATSRAREEMRVDMAIERLEGQYSELNPQHEGYNQKLTNMVLNEQRRLMTEERMSASSALMRAADDIMEMFAGARTAGAAKPGLAGAASRDSQQLTQNIATMKAQPPNMGEIGVDSDKAGVTDKVSMAGLSMEQFAALPESTKARLRGDLG